MRIGVMKLDQRLIARLKAHGSEWWIDLEDGKSLFSRRQRSLSSLTRTVVVSPSAVTRALRPARVHAKIIADACCITGPGTVTQSPARTLPDGVMAHLGLDLTVAHPGIIIPSGIVSTNVIKAEPVVIVELKPGFWRAKLPAGNAAGMIARPHRGIGLWGEHGIEEQTPHRTQYGRRLQSWQGDASCEPGQGRVATRTRAAEPTQKGHLLAEFCEQVAL